MAMGFSGSNGGISPIQKPIWVRDLDPTIFIENRHLPLEVSYFINNLCNLKCKHCYVAYEESKNSLTTEQWKSVFEELISLGALTFGNVGKEPTLSWEQTLHLLLYFKCRREKAPKLRFGLVTNGTLLDKEKAIALESIQPDYIDVSIDGTKQIHDYIRGHGNYEKTFDNLRFISRLSIARKVFISFTLNRLNRTTVGELVDTLYKLAIKKILVSPYVTLNKSDQLYLSREGIVRWVQLLLDGRVIDFNKYRGIDIYVKNDYSTTFDIMDELLRIGIIDEQNLLVDEYGVIFNRYAFNGNHVYFNYLPWNDFLVRAIRISHDGYVSDCYSMFFADYPERTIGNVREKPIGEILQCASALTAV